MKPKTIVLMILLTTFVAAGSASALTSLQPLKEEEQQASVRNADVAAELPPELHCPATIVMPRVLPDGTEEPPRVSMEECGGCENNPLTCLFKECPPGLICDADPSLACIITQSRIFNCRCIII